MRRRLSGKEGGDDNHYDNFVNAVRSRKAEELNADILEGHLSSALCHLANVSYRLGQLCPFSKQAGAFGDDKAAVEALGRTAEHLKGNKVPLEQTSYRLGRKLTVDPKAENRTCQACYASLTMQTVRELEGGGRFVTCTICGRALYV